MPQCVRPIPGSRGATGKLLPGRSAGDPKGSWRSYTVPPCGLAMVTVGASVPLRTASAARMPNR
jgi:hypothetical protein